MLKLSQILVLLLLGSNLHAIEYSAKLDSLLQVSNSKEFTLSKKINIAERAIIIAQKDSNYLINAYSNLGSIYLMHSLYTEAIKNFQRSIKMALLQKNEDNLAANYYFLGNTYLYLEDLNKALELYEKSKVLFQKIANDKMLAMIYNSQGIVYSKQNQFDNSYKVFQKSLNIFKRLKLDRESSFPIANIGDYFLKINEPDSAIKYFDIAMEIERQYNDLKGKSITLGNIGLAYQQKKQYKIAIEHFKKSLTIAIKNEFNKVIYDNYKDLSETHKLMNDYENALLYYEKHILLKDSIIGSETNRKAVNLQLTYSQEKKEKELLIKKSQINELEYSQKINRFKIYLIVSCFIILLVTSCFVVFRLRSNIKKGGLEQALIKSELAIKEKESENLEIELKDQNENLTNFALDIARKNEFTQTIDLKLKEIKKSSSMEVKEMLLQDLILKTHNHLKINQDLERFQDNVKKVNHDFFKKIGALFPDLTPNEIHLCGLIKLGLTIKDIASIKNISPKSVEMNRYRLRKKLTLKEGEDLNQYLNSL